MFCGGQTTEHPLPESGVITIGRGRDATIPIDHPTLSRVHARLSLGGHVTVEDVGSRNGTVIGGRRLSVGEVVLVAPGSPIECGDALLIVRVAGSASDVLASTSVSVGAESPLEKTITRIAESDVAVLITGEAGAGKSFLAKQIHALSRRRAGPFVVLKCAGARSASAVRTAIRSASGGVLLIHEPATLSPELAELLIDIDARDVRAITVASRELPPALVHRLATFTIAVPPLRARLGELPKLVEAMLASLAAAHGRSPPLLSADALTALGRHAWPGNVRELNNALTRALLLGSSRVLTAAHFELDAAKQAAGAGQGTLESAVNEAEHRRILEALRQCNGNQSRAAKMLNISRGTLIARLERYAVPRPRK